MNFAVIYARVSTLKQERYGVSQEAQVAKCSQYAEAMDYHVVYTGIEAESAKDTNRPELQKIMELVSKKQISHIITVKLDRLSRETEDAIQLGKMFTKKGVTLHLTTEGGPVDLSDPSQEMMFTMRAAMGKFERRRISLNTKFGMARKRELDQKISGSAPYGYQFDNGMVVVNPDEQNIISRIHELHNTGLSIRKIISRLASEGVLNRSGNPFTVRAVTILLQQRRLRMGLTEAEIDEKFRELVPLIKAQPPDRIDALKEYLDKEAEKENGSDKIREMPPARKD